MKNPDWLLDSAYPAKKKRIDPLMRALVILLISVVALGVVCTLLALETHSMPTGDVNRDGRVNAVDLTMMRRHVIGIYDLTPAQIRIGDMNRNGRIDDRDIDALTDIIMERPVRTYDD